jgi:hypothetical protein
MAEARAGSEMQGITPHAELAPVSGRKRERQAFNLRVEVAERQKDLPLADHPTNGDEERYPNKIASFTKGLPHNNLGEVDLNAYNALLRAVSTGQPADYEAIPLGGPRKLINPQAGLAFELEGPDSHSLTMPAPPAFASAEAAGEMVELYWQSLLRDVSFSDYDSNPLVARAAAELSKLSDFRGPKINGQVTPATLFRANIPGVMNGPFISQFLLRDVALGVYTITQQFRPPTAGVDYLVTYNDWLAMQNGANPSPQRLDQTRRYIINGRDLGRWFQVDVLYQAELQATQILSTLETKLLNFLRV